MWLSDEKVWRLLPQHDQYCSNFYECFVSFSIRKILIEIHVHDSNTGVIFVYQRAFLAWGIMHNF